MQCCYSMAPKILKIFNEKLGMTKTMYRKVKAATQELNKCCK